MNKVGFSLFVSSLLAACGAQLLPCAPDCSEPHTVKLFPNPHDCTKYFQCTGDFAIPRTCPDGLLFNAEIQVCDYPDSAGCTADPDYDCGESGTTLAPTTELPPTTVTPGGNVTVVTTTSAAPNVTSGGNVTVVLTTELPVTSAAPNVTSGGNVTVVTTTSAAPNVTSGGNVTVVLTTELPVTSVAPNVTSGGNATVGSTTELSSTSAAPSTTLVAETTTVVDTTSAGPPASTAGSSSSSTDSGECRPECPSDEALFPNPRDCGSFFQCAFGYPFLHQCPEGQWYDAANERCDYIELVECNAGPDAPCIAVTNPTVEPASTTTAVAGSTTTDGGEDCVPPCPSDEALYPNPRDCSSFFQCAFGIPYLMKCPAGQEYAAALERCDYPEVAQCTASPDSPCVAVTNPPDYDRLVFF